MLEGVKLYGAHALAIIPGFQQVIGVVQYCNAWNDKKFSEASDKQERVAVLAKHTLFTKRGEAVIRFIPLIGSAYEISWWISRGFSAIAFLFDRCTGRVVWLDEIPPPPAYSFAPRATGNVEVDFVSPVPKEAPPQAPILFDEGVPTDPPIVFRPLPSPVRRADSQNAEDLELADFDMNQLPEIEAPDASGEVNEYSDAELSLESLATEIELEFSSNEGESVADSTTEPYATGWRYRFDQRREHGGSSSSSSSAPPTPPQPRNTRAARDAARLARREGAPELKV